jgi:Ca2+ transporting ATPase
MITGDNPETAIAIAKEAGILEESWKKKDENDKTVMTGQEFRNFVGGLDKEGE